MLILNYILNYILNLLNLLILLIFKKKVLSVKDRKQIMRLYYFLAYGVFGGFLCYMIFISQNILIAEYHDFFWLYNYQIKGVRK